MLYDVKKYKKIQELFDKNQNNSFICRNCGREFKTFHSNHLKKCGITKDEYIKKFGYPNEIVEKRSVLQEVFSKISDLYIMNRNKWLILSGYTKSYITKNSGKSDGREKTYKLTNFQIKEHLVGKNTLGVFPSGFNSKFLVFDVDSYVGLDYAKGVVRNIKCFLERYFSCEQIHINFSGNKGYHVTLYFDEFISLNDLYKLYSIVLNEIHIERFSNVRVEMRPTTKGEDGYGVKLPMGVNFLNNDNYNNYAFYVDNDFNEIEYEIEYLLNIKKSSSEILREVFNDYKDIKLNYYGESYINEKEYHSVGTKSIDLKNDLKGKIEYVIKNGLEVSGTRHYWSFVISMYLKELGLHIDDAYNFLLEWNMKQVQNGMSKSISVEIERDLRNMIYKDIYCDNKNYCLYRNQDKFYLTHGDINLLIELNRYAKDTGKAMVNHQKVLFYLLLYGKKYCDEKGKFNLSYEKIIYHTDFGSRTTVNKCITDLDSMGYIKIVSRNSRFDKMSMKKAPNVYQLINYYSRNKEDVALTLSCDEMNSDNLFFKTMVKFFGKDNLSIVFTRAVRAKILNMPTAS